MERVADQILESGGRGSKRSHTPASVVEAADRMLRRRVHFSPEPEPEPVQIPVVPAAVSLYAQIKHALHGAPFVHWSLHFKAGGWNERRFVGYEIHHAAHGDQIVRVIGDQLSEYSSFYTAYDYRIIGQEFDADFHEAQIWAAEQKKGQAPQVEESVYNLGNSTSQIHEKLEREKASRIGPSTDPERESRRMRLLGVFATSVPGYDQTKLFDQVKIDKRHPRILGSIIYTEAFAQVVIRAIRSEYMLISEPFARRSMDWWGQIYFMQHVMRKDNDDWVETNKQVFARACRKAIYWMLLLFLQDDGDKPASWRGVLEKAREDLLETFIMIETVIPDLSLALAEVLLALPQATNGLLVATGKLAFIDDAPHSRMILRKRSTGGSVGDRVFPYLDKGVSRMYDGIKEPLAWIPFAEVRRDLLDEFEEAYMWAEKLEYSKLVAFQKYHLVIGFRQRISLLKKLEDVSDIKEVYDISHRFWLDILDTLEEPRMLVPGAEVRVAVFLATIQYFDRGIDVRSVRAGRMLVEQILGDAQKIMVDILGSVDALDILLRSIRLLFMLFARMGKDDELYGLALELWNGTESIYDVLGQIVYLGQNIPQRYDPKDIVYIGVNRAMLKILVLATDTETHNSIHASIASHILGDDIREEMINVINDIDPAIKAIVKWIYSKIFPDRSSVRREASTTEPALAEIEPEFRHKMPVFPRTNPREMVTRTQNLFDKFTCFAGSVNSMFHTPLFIGKEVSASDGHLTRKIGEEKIDLQVGGHKIDFSEVQQDAMQQDWEMAKIQHRIGSASGQIMRTQLFYSPAVDGDVLRAVLDEIDFDGYTLNLFWLRSSTVLQQWLWTSDFRQLLLWLIRNEYLVHCNVLDDLTSGMFDLLAQIHILQSKYCLLFEHTDVQRHYNVLLSATKKALSIVSTAASLHLALPFKYQGTSVEDHGLDEMAKSLALRMLTEPCFMMGVWIEESDLSFLMLRSGRGAARKEAEKKRSMMAANTLVIGSELQREGGDVTRRFHLQSRPVGKYSKAIGDLRKADLAEVIAHAGDTESERDRWMDTLLRTPGAFLDLRKHDGAIARATFEIFKQITDLGALDAPWLILLPDLRSVLGIRPSLTDVWLGTLLWNMRNEYVDKYHKHMPQRLLDVEKVDLLGQLYNWEYEVEMGTSQLILPSQVPRSDDLYEAIGRTFQMITEQVRLGFVLEMFPVSDPRVAAEARKITSYEPLDLDETIKIMQNSSFIMNGYQRALLEEKKVAAPLVVSEEEMESSDIEGGESMSAF